MSKRIELPLWLADKEIYQILNKCIWKEWLLSLYEKSCELSSDQIFTQLNTFFKSENSNDPSEWPRFSPCAFIGNN